MSYVKVTRQNVEEENIPFNINVVSQAPQFGALPFAKENFIYIYIYIKAPYILYIIYNYM